MKQDKITYDHRKVVNIFIVYEINDIFPVSSCPTLRNCLLGAVSLTKNADSDRYKYSGYEIEFDKRESFSYPGAGLGRNVVIFGVDMGSSVHVDNKKKIFLF